MAEYIEREETCKKCVRYGMGETLCTDCVVKAAPAADVVAVVHGEWEEKVNSIHDAHTGEYYDEGYFVCSVCGYEFWDSTNYCPNCGAKMDGGDAR